MAHPVHTILTFQFEGIDRNLDRVRWMAGYSFEVLSCPRADCRYLMGPFTAGWHWERDYFGGQTIPVPVIKIWAYAPHRFAASLEPPHVRASCRFCL